jgi:hypothetical protein
MAEANTTELVLRVIQEPENLEDVLETDVLFGGESAQRTMARAHWLGARAAAELLLTITDEKLGLSAIQIHGVYGAVCEIISDFDDFVYEGVGEPELTKASMEGEKHPLLGKLVKQTEKAEDTIFDACLAAGEFPIGGLDMLGYGSVRGQSLIATLRQRNKELKKRWPQGFVAEYEI